MGGKFQKGDLIFDTRNISFYEHLRKACVFGGINYGRRPITTFMPFTSVTKTGREFMDGPGSEKTWVGPSQNGFQKVCQKCTYLGGPGACSPGKIFYILFARIALVATFTSKPVTISSNWLAIMHKNHNVVTVNLLSQIDQERHFLNRNMYQQTG